MVNICGRKVKFPGELCEFFLVKQTGFETNTLKWSFICGK